MSAISGIRIRTCFFRRIASATASKYTSVLPEPVTPSTSVTEKPPFATVARSASAAARCGSVSSGTA